MKLTITTTGPHFDAPFSPRFGRCPYFIVIDTETRDWEAFPNPAVNASGGAGTQAAQFIADQGTQAVISGHYGPAAYTALEVAGIQMLEAGQGQADTLLEAFLAGKLKQVASATGSSSRGGRGRRRRGG